MADQFKTDGLKYEELDDNGIIKATPGSDNTIIADKNINRVFNQITCHNEANQINNTHRFFCLLGSTDTKLYEFKIEGLWSQTSNRATYRLISNYEYHTISYGSKFGVAISHGFLCIVHSPQQKYNNATLFFYKRRTDQYTLTDSYIGLTMKTERLTDWATQDFFFDENSANGSRIFILNKDYQSVEFFELDKFRFKILVNNYSDFLSEDGIILSNYYNKSVISLQSIFKNDTNPPQPIPSKSVDQGGYIEIFGMRIWHMGLMIGIVCFLFILFVIICWCKIRSRRRRKKMQRNQDIFVPEMEDFRVDNTFFF